MQLRRIGLWTIGLTIILSACSSPASKPSFYMQPELAKLSLQIQIAQAETLQTRQDDMAKQGKGYYAWRSLAQLLAEPEFLIQGYAEKTDFLAQQGHLALLNSSEVWKVSKGEGVVVAVIDSGVNTIPSLETALLPGYDFIAEQVLQADESGHGTSIATLIAGQGPYWGLAPKAKILPLKVLDEYNRGSSHNLIRALLFATDRLEGFDNPYPADVINLSLGSRSYSEALHETIKGLRAQGVWVIAAAGNEGSELSYPARFSEVIAVGAAEVQSQT